MEQARGFSAPLECTQTAPATPGHQQGTQIKGDAKWRTSLNEESGRMQSRCDVLEE